MNFIKDPRVEAWLRSRGIPFEFTRRRYRDIDWAEGLRKQARLLSSGGLDDTTVLTMGVDMEKEETKMPAIVINQPPGKNSVPWPISGNHRGAAYGVTFPHALTDDTEIEVYVVSLRDPTMLDMAPRLLNTMESALGFPKAERVAQAKYAMENHGWTAAFAAKEFGIRKEWIYTANSVEDVRNLVKDLPGADKIAPSTLQRVHAIGNHSIEYALVKLLLDYKVKGNEAKAIISDVLRVEKTERAQMGELAKWERIQKARLLPDSSRLPAAPKAARGKGANGQATYRGSTFPTQNRDRLVRYLTGLEKLLSDFDTLTKLQVTDPADIAVVARAWAYIAPRMNGIVTRSVKETIR